MTTLYIAWASEVPEGTLGTDLPRLYNEGNTNVNRFQGDREEIFKTLFDEGWTKEGAVLYWEYKKKAAPAPSVPPSSSTMTKGG